MTRTESKVPTGVGWCCSTFIMGLFGKLSLLEVWEALLCIVVLRCGWSLPQVGEQTDGMKKFLVSTWTDQRCRIPAAFTESNLTDNTRPKHTHTSPTASIWACLHHNSHPARSKTQQHDNHSFRSLSILCWSAEPANLSALYPDPSLHQLPLLNQSVTFRGCGV